MRLAQIRMAVWVSAPLMLAACAPIQQYRPRPIVPAETARQLESRTLNDPGLRQFIEKNLGRKVSAWPPDTWDLNTLSLAAYYFNPQMQIARAQAEAAQARVMTAGERPNPTLSVAPGIPSPYLLGLDFSVPMERAGRRGYRIEQANALSEAARFSLAATAWKVRSALRSASLNYFLAIRQAELFGNEVRLHSQQVQWLGERFEVGEIAKPEVDSARLELLNGRVALRAAEGRVSETRAALAAAIGVPVSALGEIKLSWASLDRPPGSGELLPSLIQREAALNRLDVRQSLAEYAAADAALRLELARQYPNLQMGPGYTYEERNSFFTVGLSVTLPVFNRNQGPIAEAEARRKEAAARLLATQASAIAQSQGALARYRGALAELQEARKSLGQIQNVQEPMARQTVTFGESDRLFLNSVELQGAAAVALQLTAFEHVQLALGQLEDAVERPLEAGELPPPAFNSETSRKEPR